MLRYRFGGKRASYQDFSGGLRADPFDSENHTFLIFHQSVWYLLYQIGMIPPKRPAWPLDPIPPFGVPSVISKAF
jgi:hypothetical protein